MVTSVNYRYLYSYYRIAAKDTVAKSFLNTFLSCRNVLFRYRTANYAVFPFKAPSFGKRFYFEDYIPVLSLASGLSNKLALGPCRLLYCLSVRDLRSPDLNLNIEFSAKPVNNDLKMKFSHSAYKRLACFLIY